MGSEMCIRDGPRIEGRRGLDHCGEILGPSTVMIGVLTTESANEIAVNKVKSEKGARIELGPGFAERGRLHGSQLRRKGA